MTINVDAIRAALAPIAIFESQGVDVLDRGAELRTNLCPICGERSRRAVKVNTETGAWKDHAKGCKGDIFRLLAGYAGLDVAREYPRVLELAAQIAGIANITSPEIEKLVAERRRTSAERRERNEVARAAARARMPGVWASLATRHAGGEAYLRDDRGINPATLRDHGDVVRYSSRGEPAVALRDLESGDVVGVQYRRVLPGDPKTPAETGSQFAGSCLYGRIADLDPDGVDVAVVVEGLADTLAARLAFPGCAIFGAPGAGQLETVTAAVAARVAECRGWLLIVPDDDDAGADHTAAAIVAARDAGLTLAADNAGLEGASTVRLVDLGEHHDLADAWRHPGWCWQWPRRTT